MASPGSRDSNHRACLAGTHETPRSGSRVLALTRTRDPNHKHHDGQNDEHPQPSDHHVERSSLGFGPVSTETNLGVAGQVPGVLLHDKRLVPPPANRRRGTTCPTCSRWGRACRRCSRAVSSGRPNSRGGARGSGARPRRGRNRCRAPRSRRGNRRRRRYVAGCRAGRRAAPVRARQLVD